MQAKRKGRGRMWNKGLGLQGCGWVRKKTVNDSIEEDKGIMGLSNKKSLLN